jgi:acyl carrier protein
MSRLSQAEIEDGIKRILRVDLAVDPALLTSIDEQTPLAGRGLTLDSVEMVGLALGLEETFKIEIPDGDLTDDMFENLGVLVDYIAKRVGERAEEPPGRASR